MTNDDGFDSPGLQKLACLLRLEEKNRVFVLAPDRNRSGISHALSILSEPIRLSGLEEDSWSCSGYPADCVIVAMQGGLPEKPDLVISGINRGANLGTDLLYSGTAAAARQASLWDVPAVAFSLARYSPGGDSFVGDEIYNWDMAACWSADHLEELAAMWKKDTFINVNIPNSSGCPIGTLVTWPAFKRYNDTMTVMNAPDGKLWCFMKGGEESAAPEAGSDCDAVSRNYVSVSPVIIHQTVLKELCPAAPDYAAVTRRAVARRAVAGPDGKKE